MNQQPNFNPDPRSAGPPPVAGVARGSPDPPQSSSDEFNFIRLVNVLLKRRKVVAGLPLVAAVVAAIVSLLLPQYFTARQYHNTQFPYTAIGPAMVISSCDTGSKPKTSLLTRVRWSRKGRGYPGLPPCNPKITACLFFRRRWGCIGGEGKCGWKCCSKIPS